MTFGALVRIALVVVLASDLSAQSATTPPATGVLFGTVVDESTALPVEDAAVIVLGPRGMRSATTDREGRYRVETAEERPIEVRVERIGYRRLSLRIRELPPNTPVDFRLAPRPVVLRPLEIRADARTPAFALLSDLPTERPSERARARAGGLSRAPLAGALPLTPMETGGSAGLPSAGGGGPGAQEGLGIVGALTVDAAQLRADAPVQLAESPSPLADPFVDEGGEARLWQGGAPGRVTGGAEYVVERAAPRPPARAGSSGLARVDLGRASGSTAWRSDRSAARLHADATLPWAGDWSARSGLVSRAAEAHAWRALGSGRTLRLSAQSRREGIPLGDGAAGDLDERAGAVRIDAAIGRATLDAAAGVGTFAARLPGLRDTGASTSIGRRRTRVSVELRRPLGSRWAGSVGFDRSGERWTNASSSIAGLFTDLAWAPGGSLLVAGSLRAEGVLGGAAGLSPRGRLRWTPAPGVRLELGSGVHRQLLVPPSPGSASGTAEMHRARGLHHVLAVGVERDRGEGEVSLYQKRIVTEGPGSEEPVVVRGASAAGSARWTGGSVEVAAILEHRGGTADGAWSGTALVDAERALPWRARIRTRFAYRAGVGRARVSALAGDTLTLAAIDAPAAARVDLELSRPIGADRSDGGALELYALVLDLLGGDPGPIFRPASPRARTRPFLTVGARLRWGSSPGP